MNQGTPKTLREALKNGLNTAIEEDFLPEEQIIESHVRDFLAQRFGAAMLKSNLTTISAETQLADLYEAITGKKIK